MIIAQNGANNASNLHLEQALERYGWIIMCVAIIISIYIMYVVQKRCKKGAQKMLRREMTVWSSTMNIPMAPQMAQTQHV